MQKLCLVMGNLNCAGGTERVGTLLANLLSNKGYDVTIISMEEGNKPYFELCKNINIISLFSNKGRILYRTPTLINKIRNIIKSNKIQTVIVVESILTLFTLPALYNLNVKHICWEHFNFKTNLGKKSRTFARHLAARYCDYVITLTERDRNFWLTYTNHTAQIVAIPNPSPFPPQNYIRNHENKIVLSIGRLNEQKGFDMLLDAWIKVVAKNPYWKLLIVGEGHLRNEFENFISKNNLSESVELVGNQANVSEYYRKADVLCLSSRYEGLPMVLLEAISFGLPIVSFDCDTGPAEILEGTGSILVKPNDISSLASSLSLMMNDSKKRSLISEKSYEKSKLYQPEEILNKWLEIIES